MLVEPLGSVNQLAQICIGQQCISTRYQINGLVPRRLQTDFGEPFSIDLLPAHLLNGDIQQSKQVFRCMFKTARYLGRWRYGDVQILQQFFGSLFHQRQSPLINSGLLQSMLRAFMPLVFPGGTLTV